MQAIHASPQSIKKMSNQEFMIPEYQRPYSWGPDECDQLWDDLSNFIDEHLSKSGKPREEYFLGSIVVYPDPKNKKIWTIIDGQQRLATLLMLLRAILEKASSYTILEKIIYKTHPKSGEALKGKSRLESKVQWNADREDFLKVLAGMHSSLSKKNRFRVNYERLNERLHDWWQKKSARQCQKIIDLLLENVVLLPIECGSQDDALTLFEIINDRGKPLGNTDLFKAKIYNAVPQKKRSHFITCWNEMASSEESSEKLDPRERLFRIYMHISRAHEDKYGKEGNLRNYIMDHSLSSRKKINSGWQNLMDTLKTCHWISNNSPLKNNDHIAREKIYWAILRECPNIYWSYPLHVFLNEHMKPRGDGFFLPDNMWKKYLALMEDTTRYFFIKAVVHNSVNAVKDTTYKVCADIAQKRDYKKQYREGVQKDMADFCQKLKDSNIGKCRNGLVYLAASLNSKQKPVAYSEALSENIEIEHILPDKWNNYDKWKKDSWEKNLNRIGNLVPLKKKLNIKASNEFFKRKQEVYHGQANIQDVWDLAKKKPSAWYPKDVEKRQEESLERLLEFFRKLL